MYGGCGIITISMDIPHAIPEFGMSHGRLRKDFPMKPKFVAIGLACLLLVACAPKNNPNKTDRTDDLPQNTTAVGPKDTSAVIIPPDFPIVPQNGIGEKTTSYSYTVGEDTLLKVTLTLPVANVVGNETLQTTLSTRLTAMEDQLKQEIELIRSRYQQDYEAGREVLTIPSVQVRFDLHYFTAEAASLTYHMTETTGDGMVYTHPHHFNLDLRVGSQIHLTALFKDGKTDALLALVSDRLKADPPEGLYPGAEDILDDRLEKAWYIADGKLNVQLEPGSIAPVGGGGILLTFTKADLESILSDYGKALL